MNTKTWILAVAMTVGCNAQVEDLSDDEARLGLEFDTKTQELINDLQEAGFDREQMEIQEDGTVFLDGDAGAGEANTTEIAESLVDAGFVRENVEFLENGGVVVNNDEVATSDAPSDLVSAGAEQALALCVPDIFVNYCGGYSTFGQCWCDQLCLVYDDCCIDGPC